MVRIPSKQSESHLGGRMDSGEPGYTKHLQAGGWGCLRGPLLVIVPIFFMMGLNASPARSESPAPSVHWGSTAFPDQYTMVTSGLTLNRFTPVDGLGNK